MVDAQNITKRRQELALKRKKQREKRIKSYQSSHSSKRSVNSFAGGAYHEREVKFSNKISTKMDTVEKKKEAAPV